MPDQLPGLAKAEGREPPTPPVPETVEELQAALAVAQGDLAKLREKTDAERIALNQEIGRWKAKFQSADSEVQRHQVAAAELAAESNPEKRLAILKAL